MCRVFRSGERVAIVPSASTRSQGTGPFFRSLVITSIRKSQDRPSSERPGSFVQFTHRRRRIMNTRYKMVLAAVAGAAIGATAIQGLHAQVKKVYFISESEVVD